MCDSRWCAGQVLYCVCDDATVWQYDIREINPPMVVAEELEEARG